MKNFIKILLVALLLLSITSCWKKNDNINDTINNNKSDSNKKIVVDNNKNKTPVVEDWKEYSFKLSVKSSLWMENEATYYKKWENQLIVINKLIAPDVEKLPIKMMQILSVDKNIYQQMKVNDKIYWTKVNPNEGWWQTNFFNLKELSNVPKEQIKETKKEKINWKNMTCYYFDDKSGKWKWCLYKWIFMYGENESSKWEKTTMVITEYNESVKDSIFKVPKESEITSMMELSQAIQQTNTNINDVSKEDTKK